MSLDLCHAAESVPEEGAAIIVDGDAVVDVSIRRALCIEVGETKLGARLRARLTSLLPKLAAHYSVALTGFEPPQIVRYPAGGFYRPHIDTERSSKNLPELHARKVSCVVFLNGRGDATDGVSFDGGALAFYRLAERPTTENCKTFLYPDRNLMVAFKSDTYHEVMPVTAGERWTLVTWFF
jgi:predicted 2-oxoglutarate/Fe(II)-dependent dioxygenase YbiX